ncbi:hypothetical protein [Corynebacterium yonathiae]|uniref:Secreted protein n=1 Tax=Corynebacterium yonathiae TaxID=2913504 RepID=A0ABU8Y6R7_9CORY|nr:hypothetical protein [uncultured Corynebacterium sp.]
MRMKIFVPLAATALLVAACSDSEESEPATITATDSENSADSNESNSSDKAGRLNEPMEISSLPDNDVFLTVNEITVGQDCVNGPWAEESRIDELGEDKQYLQIAADVDVQRLDNPQSSVVYLRGPQIVDKDGYTSEPAVGVDCKTADGANDSWFEPTNPGDKSRRYGAFIVPKGIKEVRIEGKTFNIQ